MGTQNQRMEDHRVRAAKLKEPISAVLAKNLIHDDSPCIDLFDMDALQARLLNVRDNLPGWLHAVAIKSCPLSGVLLEAQKLGFGAECASMGEVKHALSLGFPAEKIVYDSPVKTKTNIEISLKTGIYINLDNVNEIEKVAELLKTSCADVDITARIGLRVNPVVGESSVKILSTAGKTSKFGLLMTDEYEEKILELYKNNQFLHGLHMHVGSLGMSLDQITQGATQLVELAEKINKNAGCKQIKVLDIGGGVPNNYHGEDDSVDFAKYKTDVLDVLPQLNDYKIITEFGRSIFTKRGISISKIETVKDWGEKRVAMAHFGSNQFVREVYTDIMFHHMTILRSDGSENTSNWEEQDIAGPLCFQGDYITKSQNLPRIEGGDLVVLHDTGGYTHALYSRYNSIQSPAVYGYRRNQNGLEFTCLKQRESYEQISNFWGEKQPYSI